LASNHPVQFKDATQAIVSRLVPIHCRWKFDDEQPVGVAKWARNAGFSGPAEWIINIEMEGVLVWALEGLQRALARGSITLSADSKDQKQIIFSEANLVRVFMDDCVNFASCSVSMPDFCLAVSTWFAANLGESGHRLPSNKQIGRAIAALHDERIKQGRSKDRRWLDGIELNREGVKYWEFGKTAKAQEGKTIGISKDTPNCYDRVVVVGDISGDMGGDIRDEETNVTKFGDIRDTF
jgi:hypothetical protein